MIPVDLVSLKWHKAVRKNYFKTFKKSKKTYWLLLFDFVLICKQTEKFRFFLTTLQAFLTDFVNDLATREEVVMDKKKWWEKLKNKKYIYLNFLPFSFNSRWRIKNFMVRHPNSNRSNHIFLDLVLNVHWWKRPGFCHSDITE